MSTQTTAAEAQLAGLEAPIALRAILSRFPELRLAEQPEYLEDMLRRVLKSLRVVLSA